MYDAVLSETVTITGHAGDAIEAYSARPVDAWGEILAWFGRYLAA